MTFCALGLNHEQAPVALREEFALGEEGIRRIYRELDLAEHAEVIVLSTCNRTEAFLYGSETDAERVKEALTKSAARSWPEEGSFQVRDEEAITHVLELASGLRSQVLGDPQILAQLKEAYRIAVDEEYVDTVLHRLMHTAFRAAKDVTNETGISRGPHSISSLAVRAADDHLQARDGQGVEGRSVLVVGAGEMGRLAVEVLRSYAPEEIRITNRSPERADRLVETHGGRAVDWDDRYEEARTADLIIVATGASEPVLEAEAWPEDGATGPTVVVDIAMPRNVDPALERRAECAVFDLDRLDERRAQTERARASELPRAEAICREALQDFVSWVFHQQALQPAIETLRQTFEEIRLREIERHEDRFDEADREELDRITRSIMQKVLSVPIVRLKDAADDELDLAQRVELLHTLFARPEGETESGDVDDLDECPYIREHLDEERVWRRVARHMRETSESL